MAKNDKVEDGILIKATLPEDGKSYEFPDGVSVIGTYCFYGFEWDSYNQPLIIPEGVEEIESYAFAWLVTFDSKVVLPSTLKKIGEGAFRGWLVFDQPFKLPEGVKTIGNRTFYGWELFNKSFSIPKSVVFIGPYAFCGWKLFDQPNSAKAEAIHPWLRIDDWVFAGCWSGTAHGLRRRLNAGYSNGLRENAFKKITKGFDYEQPTLKENIIDFFKKITLNRV